MGWDGRFGPMWNSQVTSQNRKVVQSVSCLLDLVQLEPMQPYFPNWYVRLLVFVLKWTRIDQFVLISK